MRDAKDEKMGITQVPVALTATVLYFARYEAAPQSCCIIMKSCHGTYAFLVVEFARMFYSVARSGAGHLWQ